MNRTRRLTTAVAAVGVLTVAVPASASAVSTITISGATGSAPLVALLAKKYVKLKPGKVKFKLAQGGGEVGIQDAAAGRVTIGNAARDPRPSDPQGLTFYPIARDFFCFDTNPANKLPNLTTAQAQAIWTGQIRNWEDVPGATVTGTIDLIGRTAASSLPPLVQSLLLGNKTISSLAALKPSDGLVEQTVASDKNAIGFNSGYYASQKDVHAVSYNGVACNLQNGKSGQYPGTRTYYEVTRGPAQGAASAFINWIQHSAPARKIIASIAIPLS
ncbi:MAG TPA: substrate-binding domain-containing protein [Baekduia sp.]|uniref:substrate-binding domain-containing protein n=1 Tax=Baekduia sp. TaxID=2600305 RepID=UPI002D7A363B|nr:substrate-binding domain-containing protein [Baekduia sp.]HET6507197.1 substrate-binding domain-containing protein [Baekduia sp.]